MGSSNFIIFDSNTQNILSDSAYATASANGVSTGLASSALYNKQAYQVSVMAYALGQLLAAAGYTVSDSNPSTLVSNLQSLFLTPNPVLANFHGSAAPVYASSTSFTMAYIREPNSNNTFNIINNAGVTVSTSSAAINGLDTGTIASNTYYYVYAVSNGTSSGLYLSKTNSMVSGTPSTNGFNYTYYRQLPFFILTDGSANILPFTIAEGWPYRPLYLYQTNVNPVSGITQVLNGGTAVVYTAVSAVANYVPPISRQAFLDIYFLGGTPGSTYAKLRPSGMSGDYFVMNVSESISSALGTTTSRIIPTSSSQSIDYLVTSDNLYLSVAGCVIDQVT
jgi:hypothetical protein